MKVLTVFLWLVKEDLTLMQVGNYQHFQRIIRLFTIFHIRQSVVVNVGQWHAIVAFPIILLIVEHVKIVVEKLIFIESPVRSRLSLQKVIPQLDDVIVVIDVPIIEKEPHIFQSADEVFILDWSIKQDG